MLKSIKKILIAGTALVAVQSVFSMEIYTVKSSDYLYKIAKNHSITGISTSEMTDAIKGINKSEIPGIVDNRIRVGDKLAIPTTKDEVEDGLTITRNQMIQGSYGSSSDKSSSSSTKDSTLGDDSLMSPGSQVDNSFSSTTTASEDKIPTLVPGDENPQPQTYSSNINTQISSDNVEETQSDYGNEESGSFFGSLFKLIVYLVILAAITLVGKRVWENQSSRKELELEIEGKRKRDHLMSRISPVVSDNDFYKSQSSRTDRQNLDIFDKDLTQKEFDESSLGDENDTLSEGVEHQTSELTGEDEFFGERGQSVVVKTEKGVVFETNTDDSFINNSDNDESTVEEVDAQLQQEQELQYVNELIEQFLDSEKYMEASITLQDSLEKHPDNVDLRYKLLEVYAKAGDEIAFEGEVHFIKSKNIVSMFDPLHQKIARLRDKYFE